jgi:guanosine-3',5'-bis(diphosphate) 3'-pyrophosphohydrolase
LFLVNGVTKLGTLKYRGRERHVESLRKFFVAMAEDVRVIIIKLADRLHNVSTLKHLKPEKAKRIALETIEIHAPLANRLGMWKLKGQLEDLAFPFRFS